MPRAAWNPLKSLASLKVAIPLLVVFTAVTVVASLFPNPDLFRSWWYLGLMGALGLSLLLITILHIPRILRRRGRNALIGVIVTHAGILVLIAAAIQGGTTASRWQVHAVEGEMTIVPGMPFVIELVSLELEDYDASEFPAVDLSGLPKKRQDSLIRLYREGNRVAEFTAAPGKPGRFDGFTLLPSTTRIGETFELLVTDRLGREKTFPIRSWSPPVVEIDNEPYLVHPVAIAGRSGAQILSMENGQPEVLDVLQPGAHLEIGQSRVRLGEFRPYTSLSVYNRPHMPLLVIGSLMMLAGLIWHFYHRYRD